MSQAQPITLTHSATAKIWQLLQEENDFGLSLRIYVTGGGCSGFQYGFTFEDEKQEDDLLLEYPYDHSEKEAEGGSQGETGSTGSGSVIIKVLVDPMSLQYLDGSEVDYKQDVNGEQFVIRNPNAQTTCGCGSSFSA